MNSNGYTPQPADLSGIDLPHEIIELVDAISKNVHEVWSAQRMSEGWTYGPVRDDAKRETPCLVPYDELPVAEKTYDWNTAANTLKLLISLGFEIKKNKK